MMFAAALVASLMYGRAVEMGAGPSSREQAVPTTSALVHTGYLAFVKDSIVPADPRAVAAAALDAIAVLDPKRKYALPASFGADTTRDADWLAESAADLPSAWPVLDAMGRAAQIAHLGFGTPQRRQGIRARGMGEPLSAPGFNTYPQSDGTFVVFDLVKGASADVSGLRDGDVLLRVNGRRTTRFDPFLISTLPAGATVTLEIGRGDQIMTICLRLIAADEKPVESRLLKEGMGYIFIRWFAVSKNEEYDTAALVRHAIAAFAAQGARGLILDLRSAIGGSGDVEIASALCDGEVIYSVQQPLSAAPRPVKRNGPRLWPRRPIVVLLNEQTISAGEDLALALRELGHAKIIGQTSGGGLTEFTFAPLVEGYTITLPNGVVLGPVSGIDQPNHALEPDIDLPNPTAEEMITGIDRQLAAAVAAIH